MRLGIRAAGSARTVGPSGLCGLNPVSGIDRPCGAVCGASRRARRGRFQTPASRSLPGGLGGLGITLRARSARAFGSPEGAVTSSHRVQPAQARRADRAGGAGGTNRVVHFKRRDVHRIRREARVPTMRAQPLQRRHFAWDHDPWLRNSWAGRRAISPREPRAERTRTRGGSEARAAAEGGAARASAASFAAMGDSVPRLWMMLSVLGGCGARTGLVSPERDVGRDASVSDASVSDASVSDASASDASVSDASVSDGAAVGCALRLLDGPVAALSHEGGDKGPWVGPQVVFRDGAFDAVATLQAEDDDTFSQTRAMRFGYSPGAGFRIAVAPGVLFAALGSSPALVQGDALALCRWPSSGGMAAEVMRYRGAYMRLAESRSFIGATGCAGLVAAGDRCSSGPRSWCGAACPRCGSLARTVRGAASNRWVPPCWRRPGRGSVSASRRIPRARVGTLSARFGREGSSSSARWRARGWGRCADAGSRGFALIRRWRASHPPWRSGPTETPSRWCPRRARAPTGWSV